MSEKVISLRNLHLRRGERRILNGASLEVARGDVVALMGASGSGKTTVLRVLAGLEPFEEGAVTVDGVALSVGVSSTADLAQLRRKVGMVFQFHCLFEHLSAAQNVRLAPVHVHRVPAADAERRALELLKALGVEHRAQALPRELSGGEAQRVAIARALATDPPVLLMDEPTASLDPARRHELAQLLRSLVGQQGRTLVVATHDEDFARAAATKVVMMRDGVVTQTA
ncbi:MAG: ATP-binding cassette domain-containing protein [Vicinamibacterales bacterium]